WGTCSSGSHIAAEWSWRHSAIATARCRSRPPKGGDAMQSRAVLLSALVLAGATASLVAQAPPRQGGTRAPGDVAVTLRSQPAADAFGNTPLHRAVEAGDAAAVERLLKAKPDVNAMNRYHVAPLSMAVLRNDPAIVNLLLKAGADANVVKAEGEPVML